MSRTRILFVGALLSMAATTAGQGSTREPQIGYLYPAGAQRGTVVRVTAGGQFLRGARDVYVSGEGVTAKVIRYMRPLRNLTAEQRELLRKRFREVAEKRLAELGIKLPAPRADRRRNPRPERRNAAKKTAREGGAAAKKDPKQEGAADPKKKAGQDAGAAAKKKAAASQAPVTLPDHPLLYDLDAKSLRELIHAATFLQANRAKQQLNRQLAEWVLIEITVDKDAPPGDRELRIGGATGLTNPMVFQVGVHPEALELEPNDRQAFAPMPRLPGLPEVRDLPAPKPLELPVVLNGQIMPGDVDRFRFRARKGQALVFEAAARGLVPYLADAVPGWFQATLALYDSSGREVAFDDDFRFHPDPVLLYRIPENGEYELEIRDAIYRGRDDFVYRVSVGELPFITEMFPLGGRAGTRTVAAVKGWNLPPNRLTLNTDAGEEQIRKTRYEGKNGLSNAVEYAVDTLPECQETEPNDGPQNVQSVELPVIINGRISKPGDVDVFRIQGRGGEKLVAEVEARRLDSPLDSLLRVTDPSGRVLAWNDDHMVKEGHLHVDRVGLMTHHADSYLTVVLPRDGLYEVHLADAQHQGGGEYGYRLRLSRPRPDFALRVTPASLGMRGGSIVPISVHVLRQDGFDGEIEVVVKNTAGFRLDGARIPAGRDCVRMTLQAPRQGGRRPSALELEGRARIGGEIVTHRVVPAEDMMQAFLYRHLVPRAELQVAVTPIRWRVPPIEVVNRVPVPVPVGGTAWVRIKAWRGNQAGDVKLALLDPPAGVTIEEVSAVPNGFAFRLKVDKEKLPVGFADNLIVEAYRDVERRGRDGKPTGQRQRVPIGILPAIPVEIVDRRWL